MNLSTKVEVKSDIKLSHKSKILFLGSCFAKNISEKARYFGFNVCHPFGAIYNPTSILNSLDTLANKSFVTESELITDGGLYASYRFHSEWSRPGKQEALEAMNSEIEAGHNFLTTADVIILTFGTACTYSLSGNVVANCHHTDAKLFSRSRLGVDEIAAAYGEFVRRYPDKRFIFTVSPIRYLKYTLHGSRLDKGILLLAIERICSENANCSYFPAYEIVEDELRDYRFYAADMIHPSETAVDYIWEKFSECYFDSDTMKVCKEFDTLRRLENHRPSNPGSVEDRERLKKIEQLKKLTIDNIK